jgi:hypothetical protein
LAAQPAEPITATDDLYRRLVPNGHVAPDGKTVLWTAFLRRKLPGERHARPDPQLSVNLARLTTPEATVAAARPGFGVGSFSASVPIRMGLSVRHDPQPDNYAHSLVEGLATEEQCQDLADATVIVLPPSPQPRAGL